MLHEVTTRDATITPLLLGVDRFLGKHPRVAIQRNTPGLNLGHHHHIVELVEQHQVGLALRASIALFQQCIAALVKVIDCDKLAQHTELARTEPLDKLRGDRPAIELPLFPTFLELLCLAHFGCGTHGVSFPTPCIASIMRAGFMRVSTGSKPKTNQMRTNEGPRATIALHTAPTSRFIEPLRSLSPQLA